MMLSAVNLDDQLLLLTDKVHDERFFAGLAAEFAPRQSSVAQCAPQFSLCVGCIDAQFA